MMTGLLILAGVAALVWLLSRFLAYQDRRQAYNSPLRLFLALCKAQRLRWSDRWLLWRLARARRLKDPGRLFLEPQWFEASGLSRRWLVHAARLARLRDRLFAEAPAAKKKDRPGGAAAPGGTGVSPVFAGSTGETPVSPKAAGPTGIPPLTPLLPTPPNPALDIPPWPVAPHG